MVALQNEATRLERLFEHNILAKRGAFQVRSYHRRTPAKSVLAFNSRSVGLPGLNILLSHVLSNDYHLPFQYGDKHCL